jgi:queuosine precursor transporter
MRQRAVMMAAVVLAGLLDCSANWLAAHYLVTLGPLIFPSGTLAFAAAFVTYDYLRRWHGLWPTLAAITLGFTGSVVYALLFGSGIGRIAFAGLIALACSSLLDLAAQTVTLRWRIWRYVLASNALSLAVDTVVFTQVAFAALPADVRVHIMAGQYVAKIGMTLIAIPLVYGARRWQSQTFQAAVA